MAIFESRSPFKNPIFRVTSYLFLIAIISIFQSYFLEFLSIGLFKPNLILILVVWISLFESRLFGILAGFISGLLLDTLTPDVLGSNSMFLSLVGFISGSFFNEEKVFRNLTSSRFLLVTFLSSVIYNLVYYFFYQDFKSFTLSSYFTQNVLISTIYTIVIAIIPMLVSAQFIKR